MPDLALTTLDVHDDSPDSRARLTGWLQAAYRGFHQSRVSDRSRDLWLGQARAEEYRLRGVWLPEGRYGAGPTPVATYSSWLGELNTGASLVPTHLISDVTVSPAHRRQGLLRRMITADLEDAVAAGLPLAALTVSEGGIYGRFGFGPAVWQCRVEVDVSGRFQMLPGPAGHAHRRRGRMEVVDPRESGELFTELFTRWHRRSRGSVARPGFYRWIVSGEWDWDAQAPDEKLRGAVHLDADEQPDGYVLWRHKGWDRPLTVEVVDLVGSDPQVELELWRFLGGIDLTDRVTAVAPVDDPLPWALVDPQARAVTATKDLLWVRVLDVAAALPARPWFADGEVVLAVSDALGYAAGRWRLTVRDGQATVVRAGDLDDHAAPGDLRLDVAVLGSLHLGGVRVPTLAAAGRIEGPRESVEAFAAMADGGAVPASRTMF